MAVLGHTQAETVALRLSIGTVENCADSALEQPCRAVKTDQGDITHPRQMGFRGIGPVLSVA
jgi:hypothetical protein